MSGQAGRSVDSNTGAGILDSIEESFNLAPMHPQCGSSGNRTGRSA
jgi:hypothetical protein